MGIVVFKKFVESEKIDEGVKVVFIFMGLGLKVFVYMFFGKIVNCLLEGLENCVLF